MAEYRLTPRAEDDLHSIWRNIAVENEPAADKLLNRLFDMFELVAEHPGMGSARPELSPTARIVIHGNYIGIYEPTLYGALIVAVVHGRREPSKWLTGD